MFGASHSFGSQTQHTAFLQIYSSHLGSKSLMSPIQIPCWEKILLDDEILCNIWIDKVPWRSLPVGHKEYLNELAAQHCCSWRGLSLDVTCVPLARLGRVSTPSLAFLTARHYVAGCQIILEHPVFSQQKAIKIFSWQKSIFAFKSFSSVYCVFETDVGSYFIGFLFRLDVI